MIKKVDGLAIQAQMHQIKLNLEQLSLKFREESRLQKQILKDSESKIKLLQELSQIQVQRILLGNNLLKKLRQIYQKTKLYAYIIYLVGVGIFNQIAETVFILHPYIQENSLIKIERDSQNHAKSKQKLFQQIIQSFDLIIQQINSNIPQFLQIFCKQQMKQLSNIPKFPKVDSQNLKQSNSPSTSQQFKNIVNNVIQIFLAQKRNCKYINQVYDLILKYEVSLKKIDDLYQQISLNWLKLKLQFIRRDRQFVCCKTIFFHQQIFECSKRKYFEFRPFNINKLGTKMEQQQQQLAKCMAGLMNQKGGVIFLGISLEQKLKQCIVTGFQLEDKHKKQLIKFIKNSVNQIHPKHKGFQHIVQQTSTNSIYSGPIYEFNYYITIQLLNVVRSSTYQYYKDQNKAYQKNYVCKIIVKMGHPRYLYHILKNEGNNKQDKKEAQIQFYIRGDESNQKQNLQSCYYLIYNKLTEFKTCKSIEKMGERPQLHEGCRYDMNIKMDKLVLNQLNSSDESDSD